MYNPIITNGSENMKYNLLLYIMQGDKRAVTIAAICMSYKGRNFKPQTLEKYFYFIICMISRHWFQTKLLPYIA